MQNVMELARMEGCYAPILDRERVELCVGNLVTTVLGTSIRIERNTLVLLNCIVLGSTGGY
jgi:hypothetical protein